MEKIKLKNLLMVKTVKKKSQAVLFKNLRAEDRIQLSTTIEYNSYSPKVRVENVRTGEVVIKSINELNNIFDCFDLIEVKE
jgi:hypothetical protein